MQAPTRRRRVRRLVAIVFGVSFVVSIGGILVGNSCMTRRANGFIYATVGDVPRCAYAIVPGARVRSDGSLSDALLDRLDAARSLYDAGKVSRIFVSGEAADNDEDGVMARWLVAHGIPANRITRDGTGFRTRATMENARRLGIVDAVVCTQQFHLPRSVVWARHLGIDAVGIVADKRWYDHQTKDHIREAIARTLAILEMSLD